MQRAQPLTQPSPIVNLALAALLAVAALAGVSVDGVYRLPEAIVSQAVGQDWVTLMVAIPALLVGTWLMRRGGLRGQLLTLGVLGYCAYCYAMYAFSTPHNRLFLVYVAILGLSVIGLVAGAASIDREGLAAAMRGRLAERKLAVVFIAVAVLMALVWLGELVPALVAGRVPASVTEFSAPTNPVYVLDLGFALPLMFWTGTLLWRRHSLGYLLAGILLFKILTLMLALVSMAAFLVARGQPWRPGLALGFSLGALLAAAALIHYLRAADADSARRARRRP